MYIGVEPALLSSRRQALIHWTLTDDRLSGWKLLSAGTDEGDAPVQAGPHRKDRRPGEVRPRYRGAFESGEPSPTEVCIASRKNQEPARVDAGVRFTADREFGTSLDLDPGVWKPVTNRKGWFIFTTPGLLLGLWSSLPATWLAQTPDGDPLPPPWRELWTFGADHIWLCRAVSGGAVAPADFLDGCMADPPSLPLPDAGIRYPVEDFPAVPGWGL